LFIELKNIQYELDTNYELDSFSSKSFFKKFTGWFLLNKWLAVGLINIAMLLLLVSAAIGLLLLINTQQSKKHFFLIFFIDFKVYICESKKFRRFMAKGV